MSYLVYVTNIFKLWLMDENLDIYIKTTCCKHIETTNTRLLFNQNSPHVDTVWKNHKIRSYLTRVAIKFYYLPIIFLVSNKPGYPCDLDHSTMAFVISNALTIYRTNEIFQQSSYFGYVIFNIRGTCTKFDIQR